MVIIALSLGIGLGIAAVPKAIGIFPADLKLLLTSGLFTSALVAIVLNMVLPEED
jgi:xanthine permease XanP